MNFLWPAFLALWVGFVGASTNWAQAQLSEPNNATIHVSQPRTLNSLSDDPSKNEASSSESPDIRVRGIQQRIEIIKEIMARKQAAELAETESAGATKNSVPSANPETQTPPPKEPITNSGADSVNPGTIPINGGEPNQINRSSSALELPSRENKSPLEDLQIATSPVNSMELANSLFITGHHRQALKGYEALLLTETDKIDQNWLRCLAANCYRVLGQHGAAERLYREVVAEKEKSYPTEYSKWFLDHLSRRKQMQAQLEAMNLELKSFLPSEQ